MDRSQIMYFAATTFFLGAACLDSEIFYTGCALLLIGAASALFGYHLETKL